jgi:hypothetical protein
MIRRQLLRILMKWGGYFLLLFAACSAFSSAEDPLWQKAVEVATANLNWIPEKVVLLEEVYSRLGLRQEVTETYSTLRRENSGQVELTFQKVISNGRDVTDDFIQEFGKTMNLDESEYRVEHPFHSSNEYGVESTKKGKRRHMLGKSCVQYDFTYRNEKGTWQGTAWLEEETGVPLLVEGTLVSVPLDEKWYIVSELSIHTEYTTNGNGGWYPSSAVVDSVIEVDGGLLNSYKGRIRETYTFSDYRKYD